MAGEVAMGKGGGASVGNLGGEVGGRLKERELLDGCGAPRGHSPLLQAVGPTPAGILILRNCFVWKLEGEVDGPATAKFLLCDRLFMPSRIRVLLAK